MRPLRFPIVEGLRSLSAGDSLLPDGDVTHAADHWLSTAELAVNELSKPEPPVENRELRSCEPIT